MGFKNFRLNVAARALLLFGLVVAAVLLDATSFGLVLALTGVGMAVTAAAFRRPAIAT